MRFTFDPAKNERNIAERSLSFELASALEWNTALIVEKNCMSNTKPFNPERPDKDNPEWTPADMKRARPASEVLPGFIGATATEELLRRKCRPPKEHRKVNQTLRIDPDVLEAYRQEGKGWQTHINEVLRQNMPKHRK